MDNSDPKFYEVMKYPVPLHKDLYRYINETEKKENNAATTPDIKKTFSRWTHSDLMTSYQEFLWTHGGFLKNIPFISQVYLCNSITFNGLHAWSDIDLCIVTKPWYLWYARLWSWLFFSFLKLKRSAGFGDHSYKFCLSFYLDGENTNLISLRQQDGDVYLSYRVAHSVLLYTNDTYPDNHLYAQNTQLLQYLPHHPQSQTIFLDIDIIRGESKVKKIIEKIGSRIPGQWAQTLIKKVWWWMINTYKTSKLSDYNKRHIIISPTMLKFHTDKRTVYQHKRKVASRKSKANW